MKIRPQKQVYQFSTLFVTNAQPVTLQKNIHDTGYNLSRNIYTTANKLHFHQIVNLLLKKMYKLSNGCMYPTVTLFHIMILK